MNPEELIDFVGIVPKYALQFIYTSAFFPVVQRDNRFQNDISKGHLYTLVTMIGDRSVLPLATAWAPSEKGEFTNLFLNLFRGHLHRIETCHTDDSRALPVKCYRHLFSRGEKFTLRKFNELFRKNL